MFYKVTRITDLFSPVVSHLSPTLLQSHAFPGTPDSSDCRRPFQQALLPGPAVSPGETAPQNAPRRVEEPRSPEQACGTHTLISPSSPLRHLHGFPIFMHILCRQHLGGLERKILILYKTTYTANQDLLGHQILSMALHPICYVFFFLEMAKYPS